MVEKRRTTVGQYINLLHTTAPLAILPSALPSDLAWLMNPVLCFFVAELPAKIDGSKAAARDRQLSTGQGKQGKQPRYRTFRGEQQV